MTAIDCIGLVAGLVAMTFGLVDAKIGRQGSTEEMFSLLTALVGALLAAASTRSPIVAEAGLILALLGAVLFAGAFIVRRRRRFTTLGADLRALAEAYPWLPLVILFGLIFYVLCSRPL